MYSTSVNYGNKIFHREMVPLSAPFFLLFCRRTFPILLDWNSILWSTFTRTKKNLNFTTLIKILVIRTLTRSRTLKIISISLEMKSPSHHRKLVVTGINERGEIITRVNFALQKSPTPKLQQPSFASSSRSRSCRLDFFCDTALLIYFTS